MALLQEASPSYLLLSNVYESFRDGRVSHVLRARVSHVTDGTYAGPLYIRSTRPSVIWGAGESGRRAMRVSRAGFGGPQGASAARHRTGPRWPLRKAHSELTLGLRARPEPDPRAAIIRVYGIGIPRADLYCI